MWDSRHLFVNTGREYRIGAVTVCECPSTCLQFLIRSIRQLALQMQCYKLGNNLTNYVTTRCNGCNSLTEIQNDSKRKVGAGINMPTDG